MTGAGAQHLAEQGERLIRATAGKLERGWVRHRLCRQGNRRVNMFFHPIVLTRARIYPRAQQYLARRKAEGRTPREARCAL